ncbi:heavy-metal-associated domain-containing protein [Flavobacteriaceae bacterium]|nr:heavy-metal-associated domain-containing protein [Flavobacteriaceae bacterium]
MNQEFIITGMTCENCKKGVLSKLNAIPEIKHVEIDLKSGFTKIEVDSKLSFSSLEKVLGSKYAVKDLNNEVKFSKLKELFPLFLIFVYLIFGALYLERSDLNLDDLMLSFMGLFFIVFSFFKFLGYKSFPSSFATYDPVAKVIPFYGWLYPFIETILGISFLLRLELNLVLIATLVILSVTTFGVLKSLKQKDQIKCACLGTVLNLPMTEATLIENLLMIFMSLGLLFGLA